MKIVLTGASGFLGQAFLRFLHVHKRAAQVVLMASSERSRERLQMQWPAATVVGLYDANCEVQVPPMEGADVLLHLGWSTVPSTAEADPRADLRDNVEGGLRLMMAAGTAGIGRFIFLSSGGTVYGEPLRLPIAEDHPTAPISAYGASKLCFEQYLKPCAAHYGYEHVILRPSNVYGNLAGVTKPQGVIEHWLTCIAEGRPIEVWHGLGTIRDYIHVDDVMQVLFNALDGPVAGHTINVGTGLGTSLAELIDVMSEVTGRTPALVQHGGNTALQGSANILDGGRCAELLGLRPQVGLREGISRLWSALGGARGAP